MRTTLFEPDFFKMLVNFTVASAHWLVEVATRDGEPFEQVTPAERLSLVPEHILENVSDSVVMTRRYLIINFFTAGGLNEVINRNTYAE